MITATVETPNVLLINDLIALLSASLPVPVYVLNTNSVVQD